MQQQQLTLAFAAIAKHLGIKDGEQFHIFVEGTEPTVRQYIHDHDADPVAFLTNPPTPDTTVETAAQGVAMAYLSAVAIQRGLLTAEQAKALGQSFVEVRH